VEAGHFTGHLFNVKWKQRPSEVCKLRIHLRDKLKERRGKAPRWSLDHLIQSSLPTRRMNFTSKFEYLGFILKKMAFSVFLPLLHKIHQVQNHEQEHKREGTISIFKIIINAGRGA
jgi:hypothetical protein